MKALFVGAGAVGAVYGYAFQKGGGKSIFLVKAKYAEELRKGLSFYPSTSGGTKAPPVSWQDYEVVLSPQEVKSQGIDVIFLCIASDALRGSWLEELLAALPGVPVVFLQPGVHDRQYLLERLDSGLLIDGNIPIVSYHAPLATEKVPTPGFAFWVPPFQKVRFQCEKRSQKVVDGIVSLFNKGGLPACVATDVREAEWLASVVLFVLVAVLELEDWSFVRASHSAWLEVGAQAIREAATAVAKHRKYPYPGLQLKLIRPATLRFVLWASLRVVPFDFETYMKAHFTKVGTQMHEAMKDFVALTGSQSGSQATASQPGSLGEALQKIVQAIAALRSPSQAKPNSPQAHSSASATV